MSASTDLTTLAKVKTYLGLGDSDHDTLLEALIDSVSEAIEHYCGREFDYQERTEYHDGQGASCLVLKVRPVASITSLHDDPNRDYGAATLIDSSRYAFYPEEGLLKLDSAVFLHGIRYVKAVYYGGHATIPPAVEQAANILVAHFFNRGHQGGDGVKSESLGSYTVSYDTGEWPYRARGLLAEFREARL